MIFDEIIRHFRKTKANPLYQGQRQFSADCPARHKKTHLITITEGEKRVFLKCFDPACGEDAILAGAGLKPEDVWYEKAADKKKAPKKSNYLTVGQFAAIKGLDAEFLKEHGVEQHGQGIKFTYRKIDGQPAARHRIRYLNAKVWDSESKEQVSEPYGSWLLGGDREKGRLILVEGESDALTAWTHNIPALGIPGAGMSAVLRIEHLEGIKAILIVREPDSGGPVFVAGLADRLREIGYTGAAGIIEIPAGLKDLNDLHLKYLNAPAEFLEQLQSAIRLTAALNYGMPSSPTVDHRPPPTLYPLNPVGNSERLIDVHGKDAVYVKNVGWHIWDGKCWRVDDGEFLIQRIAKITVEEMRDEAERLADTTESDPNDPDPLKYFAAMMQAEALRSWAFHCAARGPLTEMSDLAKEKALRPATVFDTEHLLFNVQNGTIDLTTGELRAHDRADLITQISPVVYDPTATAPTWERFISEIMKDRPALVDFLRRLVGYCLTGSTKEQAFAILWGHGANGKSTFLEALRAVWGSDYARQSPASTLMQKKEAGSGPSPDLARLRGARLVSAVEPEKGARLAEGIIKCMTGGDVVTARFLFKEYFEMVTTHKVLLATNHQPRVSGTGIAIWRRIHLVPFDATFEGRADREMPNKLRAELPGILNWAIKGCREWQERTLDPPAEVLSATADYRAQEDILGDFLRECVVNNANAKVSAANLYEAYHQWSERGGEKPMSGQEFGRTLAPRNITGKSVPEWIQGKRQRVYRGIGLLGTDRTDGTGEMKVPAGEKISVENEMKKSFAADTSPKPVPSVLSVPPEAVAEFLAGLDPEKPRGIYRPSSKHPRIHKAGAKILVDIFSEAPEGNVTPETKKAALREIETWDEIVWPEGSPFPPTPTMLLMPDGRILFVGPHDPRCQP